MDEVILVIIGGAIGALLKDVLHDNCIELPSILKGKLNLGFLGGITIGAIVGYVIDGGFVTALTAGFTGFSVIQNLVPSTATESTSEKKTIEEIIREVAKTELVDPELAVKVAKCESKLNPVALNTNTDGSRDRGIFQINEKYHPEVTDEQAFDPVFATTFFCKAFKAGNLSWWNASKTCWDK